MDVRVSTFPSIFGESLVLRILDQSRTPGTLEELGLSESHAGILRRAIKRPNGLILVTGPTGAGKTTTLYSLLRTVESRTRLVSYPKSPRPSTFIKEA